jgi:hypothetical protein
MLLGLNIKLPNRISGGGYVPVPGNMFIVKDSAATEYIVRLAVRDGSGVDYTVPVSAKTSDGTEYYVPAYDPSLYLDYTSTFESVPGKQLGYYLVDDVSGNLTQTTFSSLITFSRASNATRYSPTGQLEYAPHNLLLQSQDFTTSWVATNVTVTANTSAAPDGSITADTLNNGTSTGVHSCHQTPSLLASTTYTFSCFIKNVDAGFAGLAISTTSASNYGTVEFNLASTGSVNRTAVLGTGFAIVSSSITAVGNNWFRCVATITLGSASVSDARATVYMSDGSGSFDNRGRATYTGTSKTIEVWGAQLAVGPNALDYTPTTTAVVYGPRFDYDPSTLVAQGLLIEEQRTNSLTYSEQFDNAAWSKTASSITANAIASPDGTLTGDKLVEDTATSSHGVSAATAPITTISTSYSISIFAKQAERNFLQMFFTGGHVTGNPRANYDLNTGTLGSVDSGITATITAVGNGWYRCVATVVAATTALRPFFNTVTSSSAARNESYTGDGTSGLFIWGAQLEAGAFATSYIPTTTAATTRSADIASIGTLSPWYNATEGTVYFESKTAQGSNAYPWSLFGTSTANRIFANYLTLDRMQSGIRVASVFEASVSTPNNSAPLNTFGKGATAYKVNDFGFSWNGAAALTDTSTSLPVVQQLDIGNNGALATNFLNGHLRRITYTPRRLTNAELQSLTS